MTVHDLKCWPDPFAAMLEGRKRFEYRRDDRGYAVGDVLNLREWAPETTVVHDDDGLEGTIDPGYTGRALSVSVTYVLRDGFGVPPGYCVMSVEPTP